MAYLGFRRHETTGNARYFRRKTAIGGLRRATEEASLGYRYRVNEPPTTPGPHNPYAPPQAPVWAAPSPDRAIVLSPAPIALRFVAHAIDLAWAIGAMVFSYAVWSVAFFAPSPDDLFVVVAICTIPGLLGQVVLQATQGRSLGKRVIGLKVVMRDDRPATVLRVVFARNVLPWTAQLFCGLFFMIDALSIFRSGGRTIHDAMAGTRVVLVR